jgi:hypothetical protein
MTKHDLGEKIDTGAQYFAIQSLTNSKPSVDNPGDARFGKPPKTYHDFRII